MTSSSNSNLNRRITALEQQRQPRPHELNWLCVAPFDESLVNNVQVFRSVEDVPEHYSRDYPNIKLFVGVCPDDWEQEADHHAE